MPSWVAGPKVASEDHEGFKGKFRQRHFSKGKRIKERSGDCPTRAPTEFSSGESFSSFPNWE